MINCIGSKMIHIPQLPSEKLILGNTITVTPSDIDNTFGGLMQNIIDKIEAGTAGVPIPTADNNVWLFIAKNTLTETITITNPYLSIEIISGSRTITLIEDFD